jgi:uncharacterized protein
LPLDWLADELKDAELTGASPGQFQGRLSRSGEQIVVRGRVRADLSIPCARCMRPTAVHVDTELSLLLEPAPAPAPAKGAKGAKGAKAHTSDQKKANGASKAAHKEIEYEFSSEEADRDTYDGETVVLDPFIREAILLEIPNFPLCSDACPGIRPAAEEQAPAPAVDPRLAPLGALREKIAAESPATKPPLRSPEPPRAPQKKKKKE